VQGEWNPNFIRKKRPSFLRGEKRERLCEAGTCQGEGDGNGRIVRNAERALLAQKSKSQKEENRNHVHLFRYTRCECGAPGGKDCRTTDRSGVENENMHVFGASLRSTVLWTEPNTKKSGQIDRMKI